MKLKKLHIHKFRLPAGIHDLKLDFGPDAVFHLDVREFLKTVRPSHRGGAPAGHLSIAVQSPAPSAPSRHPEKNVKRRGGVIPPNSAPASSPEPVPGEPEQERQWKGGES